MQEDNGVKEVEINVLNLVGAMAKELVRPPVNQLDDETIETCRIIDEYIANNDVPEFGVDIDKDGSVTISTKDRDGAVVNFEFEL